MYLLVVPIYAAVGWPNLDFMNYLTIWESLPIDAKRVGELVGVEERFLVRAMRGTINTQIPTQVLSLSEGLYTWGEDSNRVHSKKMWY